MLLKVWTLRSRIVWPALSKYRMVGVTVERRKPAGRLFSCHPTAERERRDHIDQRVLKTLRETKLQL